MAPDATAESAPTKAIRLRHPWRTVLAVVLILMFAAFVIDPAGRPADDWPSVAKYIFDRRISLAAVNTLQLMTYSMAMAIAIVLGVILAVMRLTQNQSSRASPGSTSGYSAARPSMRGWFSGACLRSSTRASTSAPGRVARALTGSTTVSPGQPGRVSPMGDLGL
jgi:hypothetical protein